MIRIFFVFILLLQSCYSTKYSTKLRVEEINSCMKDWKFYELEKEQKVKVLFFHKYNVNYMVPFPNMILGVNQNNDTIAAIDLSYTYPAKIKKGYYVTIKPYKWKNDLEDEPILWGFEKPKKIFCAVKKVYYSKFDWDNISKR